MTARNRKRMMPTMARNHLTTMCQAMRVTRPTERAQERRRTRGMPRHRPANPKAQAHPVSHWPENWPMSRARCSMAEPSTEEAEWQVNVDQALNAARMMGQLPGAGMMALAGDAKQSRTDWKAITRRFVQETAAADYSWKMPNPRYMASGIYLPRLKSENMPPIIGVIDTSASTIPYQAGFVAELGLIFDETQAEALIIIETDAGVHRVTRFERGDPVVLKELKGQGGTDFRPAFDYIEREQIEAACVIYLTDAYGTYPQPSEIPTLWALTPNAPREGEAYFPPFGETVRLDAGDL